MSRKLHEAPAPVSVAAWTTAVVGAFVLAVSVGLFVYSTISAPIAAEICAICNLSTQLLSCKNQVESKLTNINDERYQKLLKNEGSVNWNRDTGGNNPDNITKAKQVVSECQSLLTTLRSGSQTGTQPAGGQPAGNTTGTTSTAATGKCPTGSTQYAINNYPMTKTNDEDQKYFENMGLLEESSRCYRCSDICVPDGFKLEGYLSKLYAGVEKITVVRDKAEFDKLVDKNKKVARESAVILSSTKGACEGPISIDYPGLIYNNDISIKVRARENTNCEKFWKRQKKAASSTSAGGTTGAPTPSGASMGMADLQQLTQPSGASGSDALLSLCWTQLKSKYSNVSQYRSVAALLDEIGAYLSGDAPNANAGKLLERCQNALKAENETGADRAASGQEQTLQLSDGLTLSGTKITFTSAKAFNKMEGVSLDPIRYGSEVSKRGEVCLLVIDPGGKVALGKKEKVQDGFYQDITVDLSSQKNDLFQYTLLVGAYDTGGWFSTGKSQTQKWKFSDIITTLWQNLGQYTYEIGSNPALNIYWASGSIEEKALGYSLETSWHPQLTGNDGDDTCYKFSS